MRLFFLALGLLISRASFLAASTTDLAKDYIVDHWDTENGLPQNSVSSITQTRDGYLWLGTFDGLARFDGISFKIFHPDTSDFPLTAITMLAVDGNDRLWIGSDQDKLLCLTASGFVEPESWGLPPGPLEFEGESPDGNVLIKAKAPGSFHLLVGHRFVAAPPSVLPTDRAFESLRSDQRWGVWERQGTNWQCLQSIMTLTNLPSWPPDLDKRLQWLGPGSDESVWFIAQHSMRRLTHGKWGTDIRLSDVIADLTGLIEDESANLWIGTWRKGLFRLSPNGEYKRFSLTGSANPEGVRAVFKDHEGNLWVGTDGSGLFRIKPRIFQMITAENGLSSTVIRTVSVPPDGKVLALYHGGGVDRIDSPHSVAEQLITNFDLPWCGLASRNGTFWMGQFGGKIFARDKNQYRDLAYSEGDQTGAVRCLLEDDRGLIWVGNAKGIRTIERDRISVVTNLPLAQPANVRSISKDSDGKLYFALGGGGLLQLNNGIWSHFSTTNGLPTDNLEAVCADSRNVLWIGCDKKGLAFFSEGQFRLVPVQQGALPAYIVSIFDDGFGYLWLGSAQGIYRINRDAALGAARAAGPPVHVDHYGHADGLTASECSASQPSICKTPDGLLWFATYNGIAVLDPQKVPSNQLPPPLVIERMDCDGRGIGLTSADHGIVLNRSAPALRNTRDLLEVTTPPGVSRLEIQYTALSFVTPQNVRFRYKLDGLDDHWVDAGTRRSANFTKLAPGPYRFWVTACNNDGVWNKAGVALPFRVLPYYWQTGWFRALILLSLLGLAFAFYHRRIAELTRRQTVQQEFSRRLIDSQENERKRIAGELHDGLGHDLLLIKNRLLLGLDQNEISPTAKTDLRELSDIASHAISGVRELARNLRPHLLDELGPTKAIQDTIRKVGRSETVQFEQEIENVDNCLPPEFEINLFRIVQETLNNIVKHSKASTARIKILRGNNTVHLTVQDNGIGFDQTRVTVGGGFGLSGLAERARIMGGRCEIQSEPGAGTLIRIEIPLSTRKEDA